MDLVSPYGNSHTTVELHKASLGTITLNTPLKEKIALFRKLVYQLVKK